MCAPFHAAVAAAKEKDEAALEAAAAEAAAEKAAKGEEDEDHDTRKLRFPERMRLVQATVIPSPPYLTPLSSQG